MRTRNSGHRGTGVFRACREDENKRETDRAAAAASREDGDRLANDGRGKDGSTNSSVTRCDETAGRRESAYGSTETIFNAQIL